MKRIISFAVSLLIVLSCIFALAACDEVKSIASIDIASRDGLVDTYTITYTNGETSTFTVTNGKDGEDGIGGIQGIQGTPGADGHTPIITIGGGFWYVDGENSGVQAEILTISPPLMQ